MKTEFKDYLESRLNYQQNKNLYFYEVYAELCEIGQQFAQQLPSKQRIELLEDLVASYKVSDWIRIDAIESELSELSADADDKVTDEMIEKWAKTFQLYSPEEQALIMCGAKAMRDGNIKPGADIRNEPIDDCGYDVTDSDSVPEDEKYNEVLDEREALFQAFYKIRASFKGRHWLMEGRGCYPYDDERYKEEVRYIMDEFEEINKNLWKQIKSKSFEYKDKLRADIISELKSKSVPEDEKKDFQQYITNLLYFARDERGLANVDFDNWVENEMNNIGGYLKSKSDPSKEEQAKSNSLGPDSNGDSDTF